MVDESIPFSALLILPFILTICWMHTRYVIPLKKLESFFVRAGSGGSSKRVQLGSRGNEVLLSESVNQLLFRLEAVTSQVRLERKESNSILRAMKEGVLVIDGKGSILRMNEAAQRLLGVGCQSFEGRNMMEIAREAGVQRFIARLGKVDEPIEEIIQCEDEGKHRLHCYGKRLKMYGIGQAPLLIVITDITRIYELENIQREFVGNVSHELKTPITSIKGAIESLQDGGCDNPDTAQRFVNIALRQTNRLGNIVDDLLSLSQLEQSPEFVMRDLVFVEELLRSVYQNCQDKASERDVTVYVCCPSNLQARINRALIEQALVNLLDNAIKYSDIGGKVEVLACVDGETLRFEVRDTGKGIAYEHHKRIFERFYRVEKSRSRKEGGTGLGLAIVKRIAEVHKGNVSLVSELGQGSIFSLILPSSVISSDVSGESDHDEL